MDPSHRQPSLLWLLLSLCLLPLDAAALPDQEPLTVTPGQSQFKVGTSLSDFKDPQGRLSLEQVLEGDHRGEW